MLPGKMMEQPLSVASILDYAADVHGDRLILSRRVEGDTHSQDIATTPNRVKRLAHALRAMGIRSGDRVATLA